MRRVALGFVLALLVCAADLSAQVRAGGEFQVNTYTTGPQNEPAVGVNDNGDFVIAWASLGEDGSGYAVRWRKYSAAGAPLAAGQANSYTTGNQFGPSVAVDGAGKFVITWTSFGQDGDEYGIFARRFDAAGNPLAPDFRVNGHTADRQFVSRIAGAPDGRFVVAWRSLNQDGDGYGVFGRLYDSSGLPITSEFQVNTYTSGQQTDAVVAMNASGKFVVVWTGQGASDLDGVFAQRYDEIGVPLGGQFRVNADTAEAGLGATASVAMDANADFVVAWDNFLDPVSTPIWARRFDGAGVAQGSDFLVSTYTTVQQVSPQVASDAQGNFAVVWQEQGADGSSFGTAGRRFDASGAALGGEFLVNSYTTGNQFGGQVGMSPDGDFVVAWASQNQDGSSYGVFAQRYGDLIFADDFESADMSRWSVSQTDGTDLAVTAAAGQAGTGHGLRALMNDTNSLYVQDNTPSAETRYRARFYFDPNGFDPGEAQNHQRIRIFLAQDATSKRIVTLVLKRLSSQYSLEARTRLNDGSRVDTGFFPITDAPHFVEFDWHRAAPGAADGLLVLYLDGAIVSVLTNLDNDQALVESGRLGVLSVKTGASGTVRFDQFESRRTNLIGPE